MRATTLAAGLAAMRARALARLAGALTCLAGALALADAAEGARRQRGHLSKRAVILLTDPTLTRC